MSVRTLPAPEAMARLGEFDSIIDARSPAEYTLDHLPGALNWPSLDDEERRAVGTVYKQVSAFEARKLGAAIVARNISRHIERHVADRPREWQPLLYCWRGGHRSGALALVLGQIGFRVHLIEGGYKAWRAALVASLDGLVPPLQLRVLCGRTGSGKSRLLQALREEGAQVLDLEGLACHRGSVLGILPGQPQPSQKRFESLLWEALRAMDPRRPVFVESESRKIGDLRVPQSLLDRMHAGTCLHVELPDPQRVQLLLDDYAYFRQDTEALCRQLDRLLELRGKAQVTRWQALARAGDLAAMVEELLAEHYDPMYLKSMRAHFAGFDDAPRLTLASRHPDDLRAAARRVLQEHEGAGAPAPAP